MSILTVNDVQQMERTDGRTRRREQNGEAALDALAALLRAGHPQPTVNEVAARAGLSRRRVAGGRERSLTALLETA